MTHVEEKPGTVGMSGGKASQKSCSIPGRYFITILLTFSFLSGALVVFLPDSVEATGGAFGGGDGTPGNPYLIQDVVDLQAMNNSLGAYYALANNISASSTRSWNNGTGFTPIGTSESRFTGSLDGCGFVITNLYINRVTNYVGLFAYIGIGGSVRRVGLIDNEITGDSNVGSLVGWNQGIVEISFATGDVTGTGNSVGGLVGRNQGEMENSYATGDVNGYNYIGGLLGYNREGTVRNSYATGHVSSDGYLGGLVGLNYDSDNQISNSYWDIQSSGISTSDGGTGKNSVEMMTESTFTNWDFTNTWQMSEGVTYPQLRMDTTIEAENADNNSIINKWMLPVILLVAVSVGILGFAKYRARKRINSEKKSRTSVKTANILAKKESHGDMAILGSSGSGKTVFFAMLSHVLSKSKYSNLKIEYVDGIDYVRDLRMPLENGEWPAKTFTRRADKFSARIYDQKSLGTKVHTLRMNDISGEDFTKYIGPDHKGALPEHMRYIDHASGYILIVSPDTLKKDMWTFISMVKYLVETRKLKHTQKFKEPVAVVISKHDQNRNILDAESYIQDHAPDLHMSLTLRTKPGKLKFFFCSAVGDLTAEGKPRLPLAPMGIAEVIEWVLRNTENNKG